MGVLGKPKTTRLHYIRIIGCVGVSDEEGSEAKTENGKIFSDVGLSKTFTRKNIRHRLPELTFFFNQIFLSALTEVVSGH